MSIFCDSNQVILVHYLAQGKAVQLDCSSLVQGPVDAHALEGTSVLHLRTRQVLQEIRLHWVLEPFCSFALVRCLQSWPRHFDQSHDCTVSTY